MLKGHFFSNRYQTRPNYYAGPINVLSVVEWGFM